MIEDCIPPLCSNKKASRIPSVKITQASWFSCLPDYFQDKNVPNSSRNVTQLINETGVRTKNALMSYGLGLSTSLNSRGIKREIDLDTRGVSVDSNGSFLPSAKVNDLTSQCPQLLQTKPNSLSTSEGARKFDGFKIPTITFKCINSPASSTAGGELSASSDFRTVFLSPWRRKSIPDSSSESSFGSRSQLTPRSNHQFNFKSWENRRGFEASRRPIGNRQRPERSPRKEPMVKRLEKNLDQLILSTHNRDPVSLLHVWCEHNKYPRPTFLFSHSMTDNRSCFECKVNAFNISETATGITKKEAKRKAAKKILDIFLGPSAGSSYGINVEGSVKTCTKPTVLSETEQGAFSFEPFIGPSPISHLQEICMKEKWAFPDYRSENFGGSFKCTVTLYVKTEKICTYGLGPSKKDAKHQAAINALKICHSRNYISKLN